MRSTLSLIVIRVATELACSCFKFRGVSRSQKPDILCLPLSQYLSGHSVSLVSHLSVDKNFRLNAHLTDLSARQRCSGCSTTTLDKGTLMTTSLQLMLIYCDCRDSAAGLPINILRPRPAPGTMSSSSYPPLNSVKVSVQTTTDRSGNETIMDKEGL